MLAPFYLYSAGYFLPVEEASAREGVARGGVAVDGE